METLNLDEFNLSRKKLAEKVKEGDIFIYPTDTIYGIGCDAMNPDSVMRIRQAKQRDGKPFSVIAPSKSWILENCQAKESDLARLPGPFTLIMRLKKDCIAKSVNMGLETLGVRMPKHFISEFVKEIGRPIVTTSVNRAGESFMTDEDSLDDSIRPFVSFMIYEGEKDGKPSTVIDLSTGRVLR